MKHKRFDVWLRNIYQTQDIEISCTECFELVSRFVEVEISGREVVAELPHVKQHLDQCRVCREEYEILRDLRGRDEDGGMRSLDTLQDLRR